MLDRMVLNAFLVYKEHGTDQSAKTRMLLDFIRTGAEEILCHYSDGAYRIFRQYGLQLASQLGGQHGQPPRERHMRTAAQRREEERRLRERRQEAPAPPGPADVEREQRRRRRELAIADEKANRLMVERSTSTSDEMAAYQRVAAAIDATLQLAAQEEEIAPTGENYFGFIYLRIFESYDFFVLILIC